MSYAYPNGENGTWIINVPWECTRRPWLEYEGAMFRGQNSYRAYVIRQRRCNEGEVLSTLLLRKVQANIVALSPILMSVTEVLPVILVPFTSSVILSLAGVETLSQRTVTYTAC